MPAVSDEAEWRPGWGDSCGFGTTAGTGSGAGASTGDGGAPGLGYGYGEYPRWGDGTGYGWGAGGGRCDESGTGYGNGYGCDCDYGWGDGSDAVAGSVAGFTASIPRRGVLRVGCETLSVGAWRCDWRRLAKEHGVEATSELEAELEVLLRLAEEI